MYTGAIYRYTGTVTIIVGLQANDTRCIRDETRISTPLYLHDKDRPFRPIIQDQVSVQATASMLNF